MIAPRLKGCIRGMALSARERQIALLLLEEKSSKLIGAELGLRRSTVDKYRERIYLKFGVRTVVGFTLEAVRRGMALADRKAEMLQLLQRITKEIAG